MAEKTFIWALLAVALVVVMFVVLFLRGGGPTSSCQAIGKTQNLGFQGVLLLRESYDCPLLQMLRNAAQTG